MRVQSYQSEALRRADSLALTRLLFADEVRLIDAATGPTAGERMAAELDAAAEAFTAPGGVLGELGFEGFSEEIAARLQAAFTDAHTVWPELRVPLITEFEQAGAQLSVLAEALAATPNLRPVVAPTLIGAAAWIAAFEQTANAPELMLSREVIAEFALLESPLDPERVRLLMPAEERGDAPGSTPGWTLSLVPAGPAPSQLGHNHAHGVHPTIAEYLGLQLSLALHGEPLVDTRTFTWLAGRLAEGRLAARAVVDETEGALRVSTREWAQQGPHQGARAPIRALDA